MHSATCNSAAWGLVQIVNFVSAVWQPNECTFLAAHALCNMRFSCMGACADCNLCICCVGDGRGRRRHRWPGSGWICHGCHVICRDADAGDPAASNYITLQASPLVCAFLENTHSILPLSTAIPFLQSELNWRLGSLCPSDAMLAAAGAYFVHVGCRISRRGTSP